jgi:phosphoribosylaminoimidazolecarboxamide formyltransferase / IMP cyclohydrolase
MTLRKVERALISVSDKSGVVDLARALAGLGVKLISTGGTRKTLAEAGLAVTDISDLTGFPEILDGRVKTLHPRVHAGILAVRADGNHAATLREHHIATIDLVVCNLYPFEKTAAKKGVSHHEVVENIDVGGPSMIRAAAKNHEDVAVLTDPCQYAELLELLRTNGGSTTLDLREKLAAAAFARTAAYDRAIAAFFAHRVGSEAFPARLDLAFERRFALRYGENPHQQAAFYAEPGATLACVATAKVLHGKELSFNNFLDLDSALRLVREFSSPAAVVIKHNNPCGAAIAETLASAFQMAYAGDPVSAYGGVLGFNRPVDATTAQALCEPGRFIECIAAPAFAAEAFQMLTTIPSWKKSVRLLETGPLETGSAGSALDFRRIDGGLLAQTCDSPADDFSLAKVVTKRAPTAAEMTDLRFAWLVAKHVKSNAIVLAKGSMVVGVGAGQMSRVDSVHIACGKAGASVTRSVLASDAFFPFRDNIDEAAKAGVTAIVQPGGSMRDQESIDACDEHGLAMVFTGVRHFRH